MADIRVKDLTEASVPGADYYLLTDSATDGVKKVKTTNVIAKADIGLGNVDNTSDAAKDAATATLTNKTIDTAGPNTIKVNGNTLAALAGTATVTIPNSTDTLVGQATTDTLTNKTISGSSNTLSNIGNSSLTNSSMTIAGHSVALGGTQALAVGDLSAIADGTIASNISGASAAPSDNTISAVLDKLLGTTQGNIAYRDATAWAALAPGTSGYVLSTGGAAANPSWIAAGTGSGDMLASVYAQRMYDYDTVAAATAATIPAAQNAVQTGGYAAVGDAGAALYRKVGTAPSHNGKFQSADGAWWELAPGQDIFAEMFGASPSAADNTAAVQSAVNYIVLQNGGVVNFGFGTFTFTGTTAVDASAKLGVILRGKGGLSSGATSATLLKHTGAVTTQWFNFTGSTSCAVEDIEFSVTNVGFTGRIVDFGGGTSDTAWARVERCSFFDNNHVCTGVYLNKAIESTVRGNSFGGCKYQIIGLTTGGYCNVARILDNQFIGGITPIFGGGESWIISGNTFEANNAGLAAAFSGLSTIPCKGVTWIGNWFGDVTVSGGTWITHYGSGFVFTGNEVGGFSTTIGISLYSCKGFKIEGNCCTGLTTLVDLTDASSDCGSISNNDLTSGGKAFTNSGGSPAKNVLVENNANETASSATAGAGFCRLAGGQLMQWGTATVTSGTPLAINFTRAYSSSPNIQLTLQGPGSASNTPYVSTVSGTSFTANVSGTGANSVYWSAVGPL